MIDFIQQIKEKKTTIQNFLASISIRMRTLSFTDDVTTLVFRFKGFRWQQCSRNLIFSSRSSFKLSYDSTC